MSKEEAWLFWLRSPNGSTMRRNYSSESTHTGPSQPLHSYGFASSANLICPETQLWWGRYWADLKILQPLISRSLPKISPCRSGDDGPFWLGMLIIMVFFLYTSYPDSSWLQPTPKKKCICLCAWNSAYYGMFNCVSWSVCVYYRELQWPCLIACFFPWFLQNDIIQPVFLPLINYATGQDKNVARESIKTLQYAFRHLNVETHGYKATTLIPHLLKYFSDVSQPNHDKLILSLFLFLFSSQKYGLETICRIIILSGMLRNSSATTMLW